MTPTPWQRIQEIAEKEAQAKHAEGAEYDKVKAELDEISRKAKADMEKLQKWLDNFRLRRDRREADCLELAYKIMLAQKTRADAAVRHLLPADLGHTLEDLREKFSVELKHGKVRDYVELEGCHYAVVEWLKELVNNPREEYTLLRLIPEGQWRLDNPDRPPVELKGKLPKCLNNVLVAGPDGKRWIVDDSAPIVVGVGGEK